MSLLVTPETAGDDPLRTGRGLVRGAKVTRRFGDVIEPIAFWLFVATLAWAPFPLGSNRPWAWSLLALLVSLSWVLWLVSGGTGRIGAPLMRRLWPPIFFVSLCLIWGCVQALPGIDHGTAETLWAEAADALGTSVTGSLSLDPWQTIGAVMRLTVYVMTAWLALIFCLRPRRAATLLGAIILIGAGYAVYAFAIDARGLKQFELFYPVHSVGNEMSGPFVNRNSFATYAGLIALSAAALSVDIAGRVIAFGQGTRRFLLSLAQFVAGSGMLPLLAFFVSGAALVATGSRAGLGSAAFGLSAALVLYVLASASRIGWQRFAAMILVFAALTVATLSVGGERLMRGAGDLIGMEDGIGLRRDLWVTSLAMIRDAPWTGFGLGSFETVFPTYTGELRRLTVDKAHNDFLEFAAGIGLPAAILWWAALLWLTGLCVRAVFVRKYERIYPVVAVGATGLVGFHALFDFSLQMPAVAMTYAALLGLGVAQSFSSREI